MEGPGKQFRCPLVLLGQRKPGIALRQGQSSVENSPTTTPSQATHSHQVSSQRGCKHWRVPKTQARLQNTDCPRTDIKVTLGMIYSRKTPVESITVTDAGDFPDVRAGIIR